jgi:hypothetical protein
MAIKPTKSISIICFSIFGNRYIVSLRLLSELGPIMKLSGQVVNIYDITGIPKLVVPEHILDLEPFM